MPRARSSWLLAACCVTFVGLVASPALAQTSRAEALEAFQHGVAEMETEDWNLALGDLERSYELYPTQVALWDIAVCLEALQRYAEANVRLRRFLADYGALADETRLREVNDMIERIARSIARVRLDVDVDGAEIRVDGRLVGRSPLGRPLELDAGRHEIVATHIRRGTAREEAMFAGGQFSTVNLHLAPRPVVRREAAPARPASRSVAASVAGPRLRTVDVELGLGIANRDMEVEVLGSPKPRSFSAPGYPEVALGLEVFPLAFLAHRPSLLTGIGFFGGYRRDIYLQTSGMDAESGTTVDVPTAASELRVGLLWRAPITRKAEGPMLISSLGYGYHEFALDPEAMSQLQPDVQMPTMTYWNLVSDLALELPRLVFGLTPQLGLQVRYVTDIGQDARDLFGADSKGGWAYGVRIALGGRGPFLDVLRFWVRLEYTAFRMEFSGPSSWGDGPVGGFRSGIDEYLHVTLALAYRREE